MEENQVMEVIVEPVIAVVIYGLPIHFVNVWEETCAVAFKIRRGCMEWYYDVSSSTSYCAVISH